MSVSSQVHVESIIVDIDQTPAKRNSKERSISKPKPTERSLPNTTEAKFCKSCCKPGSSDSQQKDRKAWLLDIIRHQISKNGLDQSAA